jgi:hypothetical protein
MPINISGEPHNNKRLIILRKETAGSLLMSLNGIKIPERRSLKLL